MFTVELLKDQGIFIRLPVMGANVRDSLDRAIFRKAVELQRYVVRNKLSAAPGFSSTQLHKVTGNLQQSIQQDVKETATEIVGRVFSAGDVKYAAIHEYGGVIQRYGKKVGDYSMRIPARSFVRSSLEENREGIIEAMDEAVMEGLRK